MFALSDSSLFSWSKKYHIKNYNDTVYNIVIWTY
jgi:hypothetical protein